MHFDNPLFIILIFTGISFLCGGYWMINNPATQINSIYGYKTFKSMKTQKAWDFAQIYGAKQMIRCGWIMVLCSILGVVLNPGKSLAVGLSLAIIILLPILFFIRVERAIDVHVDTPSTINQ